MAVMKCGGWCGPVLAGGACCGCWCCPAGWVAVAASKGRRLKAEGGSLARGGKQCTWGLKARYTGSARTARAAWRGHLRISGPPSRRRIARADARRIAAHNRCRRSARTAEGSAPVNERAAAAFERALRVQAPDGPQPPLGSATIGMKDRPCDRQSAAVPKSSRLLHS